jgi:acetyl-CoA acetyltransferase
MATDDIWILGIYMTKFGKYPDKDIVDLAADATMGALADAGVTMKDIGVMAAGNLMGGGGVGQQVQKQVGQTGIPVYNVANACATGATALRTAVMAVKAGECDYGLAVGVEKLAGAGLLGAGGMPKSDKKEWNPSGRFGSVATTDGRIGTNTMPGVFAQVGMEYGHKYGGATFELFARISEKNHSHSTLNPMAAYQKKMSLDEIMNDVMIAYPNTRPMCSANCDGAAAAVVVSDAKLKTLDPDQRRINPDHRSVAGGVPDPPRRQHADAQCRREGVRASRRRSRGSRPRRAARLLRDRRARALRQPDAVRAGRSGAVLRVGRHVARRLDAGQRVGRARVQGPPDRRHRHRQHLGGLPSPAR